MATLENSCQLAVVSWQNETGDSWQLAVSSPNEQVVSCDVDVCGLREQISGRLLRSIRRFASILRFVGLSSRRSVMATLENRWQSSVGRMNREIVGSC